MELEGLCKLFIEQADLAVAIAGVDTNLTYANPALLKLLEVDDPEELYGKSGFHFYDPKVVAEWEDSILTTIMDTGHWRGDLPMISKSGKTVNAHIYCFAIKDDTGKPFAFGAITIPKE